MMNKQRILEYGENVKDFKKYEQGSTFFFLHENDSIKAFGMLKPVTIAMANLKFDILGIGNIIAIDKGKGYGTELMKKQLSFLLERDKSGLGFCKNPICNFYSKCGFKVVANLASRMRYLYFREDGFPGKTNPNFGLLYFQGSDRIIDHLTRVNDLIYIDVPFW
jgi:hypothetical protein